MSSGPIIVKVFEGDHAISNLRKIMGATIPSNAKEGEIRKLYGNHEPVNGTYENAIHGAFHDLDQDCHKLNLAF